MRKVEEKLLDKSKHYLNELFTNGREQFKISNRPILWYHSEIYRIRFTVDYQVIYLILSKRKGDQFQSYFMIPSVLGTNTGFKTFADEDLGMHYRFVGDKSNMHKLLKKNNIDTSASYDIMLELDNYIKDIKTLQAI